MPRLFVESDAPAASDFVFQHDTTNLLAFLSFGSAAAFGAAHPLAQLVRRLQTDQSLDLRPLLTFYDRNIEDDLDRTNLDAAWQEPAPLRACVAATRAAIVADEETRRLWQDFPLLPVLLDELEQAAAAVESTSARIRVTFTLD